MSQEDIPAPDSSAPVRARRRWLRPLLTTLSTLVIAAIVFAWWSKSRPDFEYGPLMESPRRDFTATAIDEQHLLVVGGEDEKGNVLATWELFDATKMAFTKKGALPHPVMDHTATYDQFTGKIIIAGGWDGARVSDDIFLFDTQTSQITSGPKLHFPRRCAVAVGIGEGPYSGAVLIAGGADRECGFELYHTSTGEVAYREGPGGTLRGATLSYVLLKEQYLLAGGRSADGRVSDHAWLVDPGTMNAKPTGPMKTARYGQCSTGDTDWQGSLLAGGIAADGTALSSTEYYEGYKGAFEYGPQLPVRLFNGSAAAYLSSNMVIDWRTMWGRIICGGTPGRPSPRTEVLWPDANGRLRFDKGPRLRTARYGAKIGWFKLGTRDICIVLGGKTRDAHATATVEIADSKQFYIRRHRLENAWLKVYDLIGNTIRRWRGQPPVVRSNLNM